MDCLALANIQDKHGALMEGFILLDETGAKLTRELFWSDKPDAGWLRSSREVESLLYMATQENWKHKPVYFQRAELIETDGDVNVRYLSEPEML